MRLLTLLLFCLTLLDAGRLHFHDTEPTATSFLDDGGRSTGFFRDDEEPTETFGEEQESTSIFSSEPEVQPKVLYLSYTEVPERVFRGEIFSLTLKVLSTEAQFEDIDYTVGGGSGYKLLTPVPERRVEGRYYYDTFFFQATGASLRTPELTAAVRFSEFVTSEPTTLEGKSIDVITLNPPKGFAHILADHFEITNYKTTRYNRGYNIAVFNAKAMRCNIEALHFDGIEKQGTESVAPSHHESLITYYAILPKKLENLKFSFFDLKSETFVETLIPIIVEDDTVSTQSDLKPTEHRHTLIKVAVAGGIALLALILFIMKRRLIVLPFIVLPMLYIAYAAVPIEYACIKPDSPIYLLPMENSTTFEVTTRQYNLEVQGRIENYTKVKLENNKIGWVSNEDLCVH
jgi:hypothetical protein